jgi:iron(III) transport system ATP-binding protein
MTILSLDNLSKQFGTVTAVDALSLEVDRGEIFGVLGPSGSGKTTALRMIAGLEEPNAGSIRFEGADLSRVPADRRGFGLVFQDYALFPHLTVFENIAFGLRARGAQAGEINEKVLQILEMVKLAGFGERRVNELSGGEQQRVAIGRALAFEPHLLLFDEPFSNLDVGLRNETRIELRRLIKELDQTAIYVTHDQEEAFTICDRIAVMEQGRVLQIGTPRELYEKPVSVRVASFLGRNNLIPAIRISSNLEPMPEFKTLTGDHLIHTGGGNQKELGPINKPVTLAIRPEYISIFDGASFPADNVLRATVSEVNFTGPTTTVRLRAGELELEALVLRLIGLQPGDTCMVGLPPDRISVLQSES